MTKKLEEILNLPDSKEIIKKEEDEKIAIKKSQEKQERDRQKKAMTDMEKFDKIAAALPHVRGLDQKADEELGDIAQRALNSYEDLMDLGMNVEGRYAGRIFEVAGNMLKTSLDAKVAKIDKKLKMVDLQLKKEKIDNDRAGNTTDVVNGDGYVITDRNSLMKQLRGNADK